MWKWAGFKLFGLYVDYHRWLITFSCPPGEKACLHSLHEAVPVVTLPFTLDIGRTVGNQRLEVFGVAQNTESTLHISLYFFMSYVAIKATCWKDNIFSRNHNNRKGWHVCKCYIKIAMYSQIDLHSSVVFWPAVKAVCKCSAAPYRDSA